MVDLHALPTETLLDESTVGLDRWVPPRPVVEWMADLAEEPETAARCQRLFAGLRKQLNTPLLVPMARGLISMAVRHDPRGAAALSAFLSVSAPGEMLIERVRDFANLHRQCSLYEAVRSRGGTPSEPEQALLSQLEEINEEIGERWPDAKTIRSDNIRDRGPAGRCRFAFADLAARLDRDGTLDPDDLEWMIRLARLELTALEQRASHLAGAINPYSARHVSQVMPILSETDADLRDMRDFLGRLAESRRPRMFYEQTPAIAEHLDGNEEHLLRNVLRENEVLKHLWRLLRALDRNPLPQPTLSYLTERVMAVGEALAEAKVRRQPLDLVAALLIVFDHYADGTVRIQCSRTIVDTLRGLDITGVVVDENSIRIPVDAIAARRMPLPHGLPLPAQLEAIEDEEQPGEVSVKDLVMANLNNTSVLLGLLKNQKVVNTPGVVAMVAERCRNMRVLDVICTTRALHTGHANRDVPLALLRSPSNIPIKILRRFINVRYIRKVDLARLARDRTGVRREVQEEVEAYLKSLN